MDSRSNILAIIFWTFLLPLSSYSQLYIGPKAGVNLSNINTNQALNLNKPYLGLNVGCFIHVPISEKVVFVPDLKFSQKGSKIELGTVFQNIRLNYLQSDLLLGYKTYKNLQVHGGIYIAKIVNGRGKSRSTGQAPKDVDVTGLYNGIDAGYALGLAYYFVDGQSGGIRYSKGLTNILTNEEALPGVFYQNVLIEIFVGFNFYDKKSE